MLAATSGPCEALLVDDRRVDDLVGPQPLVRLVPAELGGVAERDVFDVDEHLVLALLVPHLVAGVAGVDEDRADGELVPRDARPVLVPLGVVRGRAGDAVAGQAFGDGVEAVPGE